MMRPLRWISCLAIVGSGAVVMSAGGTVAAQAPEVVFEEGIVYGTGGEQKLTLNLARPAEAEGALPCVVVIHGGAWRTGDKAAHNDQIREFARRGYVSATVGYRFCPKDPFPAQVEDVQCAVRFLRAHAEEYGIDPARIGAVGFSAGAHLSMMLGVLDDEDGLEGEGGWAEQSSKVSAVVSFFGPTDLMAKDFGETSKAVLKDFIGGTPAEKPDAHRRASPVTYVNEGDAVMLLFQGTKDPLVPHTQAYAMLEALTAAGVPGRVELLLGAGHGWSGAERERTVRETLAFFDEHLKETTE